MNSLLKKGIALTAALALPLVACPGTSLAYLTDSSAPIDNRITFPSLEISLTETLWDPDEEHLITPGTYYDKNPVTTLKRGSVASYIFMEVTADSDLIAVLTGKTEAAGDSTLYYFPQVNPAWVKMEDVSTADKYVYRYAGTLTTFEGMCEADIPLPALFDRIQVKADATNAQLDAVADAIGTSGTVDIRVSSHAVQQAGFASAAAAYAAAYGN